MIPHLLHPLSRQDKASFILGARARLCVIEELLVLCVCSWSVICSLCVCWCVSCVCHNGRTALCVCVCVLTGEVVCTCQVSLCMSMPVCYYKQMICIKYTFDMQ